MKTPSTENPINASAAPLPKTPASPRDSGTVIDTVLLGFLVLAMCSQINLRALGRDTFATEGFVTKQLFVALSDVALLGCFAWFVVRTTTMKAWNRLWWPPLPCWALLAAMLISYFHAPRIIEIVGEAMGKAHGPGAFVKALLKQESKEAIAETVQFAFYFVGAPLLFVNLIHDRRARVLMDRRPFALHVFSAAVLLNVVVAAIQMWASGASAPRGLFGSANIYGEFLALSLPILAALAIHGWRDTRPATIMAGVALLLAVLTIVSPWALGALLVGVAVAGLSQRLAGRTILVLGALLAVSLLTWRAAGQNPKRADFLRVASPTQKVKKQYIEWYAAQGWSRPGLREFATGVGPGNYQLNIGELYSSLPNEEKMPPDSNNLFLVQGVALGALGLGALLWVFGHFAGMSARASRFDWLGAGALGALCAWALVNAFHAGIVRGAGIVLAFAFSLAAIANSAHSDSGETTRDEEETQASDDTD